MGNGQVVGDVDGVEPVDGDLEEDLEGDLGDGQTAPQELTQVQGVVVNVPSEDVAEITLEVIDE